ncbi:hypothetical protein FDP51_16475 [Enterococcus mundtii]|nr:hypothetical protein [Enterococcus mundtii]
MLFNFCTISAYLRRSRFCSRRFSGFAREANIKSDFCPTH